MKTLLKTGNKFFISILILIFVFLGLPATGVSADETEFKCWAVFIGLSEYQHIEASPGCAEGAEAFHETISPIWGEEQCQILINEEATKSKVKEAIGWLADNAGENDTVLFYYAGHGTNGGYISTYRSLFIDSWISTTELKLWLQGVKSVRMAVILDTCLAGRFNPPLSQQGRVILSSSRNTEFSYTIPEIGGIFTISLLGFINDFINNSYTDDYSLTAEELFEAAESRTIEQTEIFTETVQHPVMSDEYEGELDLLINYVLRTDPLIMSRNEVFSVDGEQHTRYDILTWAPGSVHYVEIFTEIDTGKGKKYLFSSWENGDTSPTRIVHAGDNYTVSFDTQFQMEIISEYGSPEGQGWYYEGNVATISVTSIDEPTERHYFTEWSGDFQSEENTAKVTMDAPKTITANWKSEYLLNIESNWGEPTGAGWYDDGNTAKITVESVEEPDAKHHFTGWSGDYSGSENDLEIIMDSAKSVTANWESEYLLNIESDWGEPTGAGWYDDGNTAKITVESVEEPDAKHHFIGWSGDYSGSENDFEIIMDSAKSVTANWESEYLLQIDSDYGVTGGEGWYKEGATATISVPNSNGFLIRQVFNAWNGDYDGKSSTAEIDINRAMMITAEWRTDYIQLYILIGVLIVISATFFSWFCIRRRKRVINI